MLPRKAFLKSVKTWNCTTLKTMKTILKEWLSPRPLKGSFTHHKCQWMSTMSKGHPASVSTEGGTLTWSGLTGDWELLYPRHGGIAVVVRVQDPPVWALPEENPVEKQTQCVQLLKEHFCQKPIPLRRGRSLSRRPARD